MRDEEHCGKEACDQKQVDAQNAKHYQADRRRQSRGYARLDKQTAKA
jgi:hypothetical protein